MSIANQINDRITMMDVCEMYGLEVNQKGFAVCPFHNEKTASFKIYPENRGFYCFGCGKSGSVIDFVMDFFELPFIDAARKLDHDFSLGLFDWKGKSTRLAIAKKEFERKQKLQKKKEEKERISAEFWNAFDEVRKLEIIIKEKAPKSIDEEPTELFIDALKRIGRARYLLDCAETERYEYEQNATAVNT